MEPSEERLTDIGGTIRAMLTAELDDAEQLRVARRGLLEHIATRRRPRRGWFSFASAVAGLCVASAGAAAVLLMLRAPVTFQIGKAATPGKIGDVVEATTEMPVALSFSEGSSVVVREGGRLRVLDSQAAGARVLVETGTVDVAIVHRRVRKTDWKFELGPFRVQVTGTRFHAGWNPVNQTISVSMLEGSVMVSGRCLDKPRAVVAGEQLETSCPAAPTVTQPLAAEPPKKVEPPAGTAPPAEVHDDARDKAAVGIWRPLLAGGRLRDALRAAEGAGFDRVCATANARELLQLSDAARLAGHTSRAAEALTLLRKRFPRSSDAANAAFALGRIAFERRGGYDDAVHWFATYLDEQPGGALMGDAVGRLMEARHRSGDRMGARADAERYLRRFPEGPYAREARSIAAEH